MLKLAPRPTPAAFNLLWFLDGDFADHVCRLERAVAGFWPANTPPGDEAGGEAECSEPLSCDVHAEHEPDRQREAWASAHLACLRRCPV